LPHLKIGDADLLIQILEKRALKFLSLNQVKS
jgi:hypothetical protein